MTRIGIVGLPNVGKSTFFNALTNSQVEASNYPFTTIDPNSAIVEIDDSNLEKLSNIFNSKKIVKTQVEFVDIAGLVKNASKGEGLGNKFLENIRGVDVILNIVRLFDSKDIVHYYGKIDPINDIDLIHGELMISDLEKVKNWLSKNLRKYEISKSDEDRNLLDLIKKIKDSLSNNIAIYKMDLNSIEKKLIKQFSFLSSKPMILVGNVLDEEIGNPKSNKYYDDFMKKVSLLNLKSIFISSKIEYEISKLPKDSKMQFMSEFNILEPRVSTISKISLAVLGKSYFYTAGEKEVRSWIFKQGDIAPDVASAIHSDIKRGFIKVEVYRVDDIVKNKSLNLLKSKGLIRVEGKDYIVNPMDVLNFKFNV